MTAVIQTKNLSKWYGNVLGLSDVTLEIEPGITGILGPNGAGKSTFLKLITGQIKSNIGTVTIKGQQVWNNYPLFSQIGFCPEQDSFYDFLSGFEFVFARLRYDSGDWDYNPKVAANMLSDILSADPPSLIRCLANLFLGRLRERQSRLDDAIVKYRAANVNRKQKCASGFSAEQIDDLVLFILGYFPVRNDNETAGSKEHKVIGTDLAIR